MYSNMKGSLHYYVDMIRGFIFSIYILTLTHVVVCIWFAMACNTVGKYVTPAVKISFSLLSRVLCSCRADSWASDLVSSNTTAFHDYMTSLYWAAATTTTVGYGDISAVKEIERVFAMAVMIAGVWVYGYALGLLAAHITNILLPR